MEHFNENNENNGTTNIPQVVKENDIWGIRSTIRTSEYQTGMTNISAKHWYEATDSTQKWERFMTSNYSKWGDGRFSNSYSKLEDEELEETPDGYCMTRIGEKYWHSDSCSYSYCKLEDEEIEKTPNGYYDKRTGETYWPDGTKKS